MEFTTNNITQEFSRLLSLAEYKTKDWALIRSKYYLFGIVIVYLSIAYIFGPAFMRKRKPYNINKVLIVYNTLQIIFNAYLFYAILRAGWFNKYKFICEPIDYTDSTNAVQILDIMWEYLIIKIFDMVDTIFFVLRKKQNQITFLHTYHHGGMVVLLWMAILLVPGGHGTFVGLINSFVHVIMYTYYLLTSLQVGQIWWKKHITQLQIFQFLLICIQSTLGLLKKDCQYPKLPLALFLPHNILMTLLFYQFYKKTYVNKKNNSVKINRTNVTKNKNDNKVVESSSKKKQN